MIVTDLFKHIQVFHGRSSNTDIEDAVEIDYTGKSDFVTVCYAKPIFGLPQNVCVGSTDVTEI